MTTAGATALPFFPKVFESPQQPTCHAQLQPSRACEATRRALLQAEPLARGLALGDVDELHEEALRVELLGLCLCLERVERRPGDGLDDVREPRAEVAEKLGVHLRVAGERARGIGVRGAT